MKCKICGKEVNDAAKFCPKCGSSMSDQFTAGSDYNKEDLAEKEKICPVCGKKVKDAAKFCNKCGFDFGNSGDELTEDFSGPNQTSSSGNKIIIIIVIIILTLLLAIGGLFFYKSFFQDKSPSEGRETTTENIKENIKEEKSLTEESGSISIATTEEKTKEDNTSNTSSVSVATTEVATNIDNEGLNLDYCNNSYCGIENNLNKEAFQYVELPGTNYHFYYPKYLYNNWSYTSEDGFNFWYEENGTTITSLHVYSEVCSGDALTNAANLSNSMKGKLVKVGYTFPDDIVEHGIGEDGIMQVVVSGWTNSGQTDGKYMVGGNDGYNNYIMEITYPDYNKKDDLESWDYIVDTLYRYCSFSGSTKAPFSNYSAFVKEYK